MIHRPESRPYNRSLEKPNQEMGLSRMARGHLVETHGNSPTSGPIVVQVYNLHGLNAEVMAAALAAQGIEAQELREGQVYARLGGTQTKAHIIAQTHYHSTSR